EPSVHGAIDDAHTSAAKFFQDGVMRDGTTDNGRSIRHLPRSLLQPLDTGQSREIQLCRGAGSRYAALPDLCLTATSVVRYGVYQGLCRIGAANSLATSPRQLDIWRNSI